MLGGAVNTACRAVASKEVITMVKAIERGRGIRSRDEEVSGWDCRLSVRASAGRARIR